MSKLVAIMSMSLDGFVAEPNDGVAEVFDWYFNSGDVEFNTGGSDPMTGKSVAVHGADTIQQLLNAELLDEMVIDVAAVLLGSGVRLFDRLAGAPSVLGNPSVIAGVGVTHLRYRIQEA